MIRDAFTMPLNLGSELIIDNFAGGGGTSTGLEQAFGRPVDIAINHDPQALAMHAANHPYTKHLCESVWDVDPIEVTGNQPVGLVWLSPDCKHFSKAKGGKPVEKRIRGLAWVALRWAAKCKPRIIMLENVGEFVTWGPLLVDEDGNAKPDPAKKGRTFDSFIRQMRGHGYAVEWRELRACDFGAPTIRKRFFMIARRDGRPIVWPQAEFGDWSTATIADAYGGDEAEEVNARTGCIGCPLAQEDKALDTILLNPQWAYLAPLKGIKVLWRELREPQYRLRKAGLEILKSGKTAANPQRMGPLTFEARLMGLERILTIQSEINAVARATGRPEIDLINIEEETRIRGMCQCKNGCR